MLTQCWEIGAKAVAFATIVFSLAGGVVNEITPYLIEAVGFWVFIIFAIVNFGMLVPIFFFYIGGLNSFLPNGSTDLAQKLPTGISKILTCYLLVGAI